MGEVYRGYERTLDRHVAIKVLPADRASSPDFVRRFKAEATAAAKLIHPNIIQIYFIGEDAGHHFFVMQYVAGESLADLLQRRGMLWRWKTHWQSSNRLSQDWPPLAPSREWCTGTSNRETSCSTLRTAG